MAIEVLPSEVVDQIAAGEVVERPAHMVKELVENSLDAGATEIIVEFGQGGRFVKVTDNGCGLSAEDLPKAFLRFATSKIRVSDDLWHLQSFGFRGEALASIGSVARVTLFASADSSGEGFRLTCRFGALSSLERVSRSRGCTVMVENLFENVPARLKFMKGEAAEAGQIKQVLKALAMANPGVAIRVLQEGKLLFYWPATASAKERIEAVLDIKPLYEGTATRGRVRARCFFSDPHQVSRVSKSLWFFAQNRYVQDRSLQAAVMEAYRNLLMTGEYPYAVCFLETDPSEIDVNIHPTKSQVKFVSPQEAFRAVQGAIRQVLEQAPWLLQNPDTAIGVRYEGVNGVITAASSAGLSTSTGASTTRGLPSTPGLSPTPEVSPTTGLSATPGFAATPANADLTATPPNPGLAVNLEFSDEAFQTTHYRNKAPLTADTNGWGAALGAKPNGSLTLRDQGVAPGTILTLTDTELGRNLNDGLEGKTEVFTHSFKGETGVSQGLSHPVNDQIKTRPSIRHWSLLQVIGQAGLTYIVCQSEKGIVLIDQHAAHERVAFERLMAAWKGGKIEVQNFLFPLSVDLNEEKMEVLRARNADFAKLGITLEELGPTTLGVLSAPALLKDSVLVEEIERFATAMLEWGDADLMEKAMAEVCARMACHSVLRAGQSLSMPEMVRLLEEMDEHPLSSFCPHGRPVSVTYSWPELEKDFGRRV